MTHSEPAPVNTPAPGSAADLPITYNAADILERNVARHPHKDALHTEDGVLTFQAVSESANRVAHALSAMDVQVGDCVAILCLDTAEWVATFSVR